MGNPIVLIMTVTMLAGCAAKKFNSAVVPAMLEEPRSANHAELIATLLEAKDDQMDEAAMAVAEQGDAIVDDLVERFNGANDIARYRIAWALSRITTPADNARIIMKAALTDSSLYVRYCAACYTAHRVRLPDTVVVDTLIGAVNNKEAPRFRLEGLVSLGKINVPPKSAIAPVIKALEDSEEEVSDQAYRTLQRWVVSIETQQALEKLSASWSYTLQSIAEMLLAQTLDKRAVNAEKIAWVKNNHRSKYMRSESERLLRKLEGAQ